MTQNIKKAKILVVDDESSILDFLEIMLSRVGHTVVTVSSGHTALKRLSSNNFDLLITDISMPEMNGIELLKQVKASNPLFPVIVMTAYGSTDTAVDAMKIGAADYLTKPFQIDEMKLAVQACLKVQAIEQENRILRNELGKSNLFDEMVGNSKGMIGVFELVKRFAPTKTNILVQGESGTGKELIAHAIHRIGSENIGPFVAVNCAAIPEALFESEMFGHKKGAFTGANQDRAGYFEQANGGTLFLDEIGEVPLSMQVKLLRAIQQKRFHPLGAQEDLAVELRIISATNRNLEEEVKKGTFREDLFYRLNVLQIQIPPLRERREDIPLLALHFMQRFNLAMGKSIKSLSKEALRFLSEYNYPGNVRELENIVERAVALESTITLLPENLPKNIFLANINSEAKSSSTNASENLGISKSEVEITQELDIDFNLEKGMEKYERLHILKALEISKGVKKKAAEVLGISFRSLRYRIEKYGISDPSPEEGE